MGLDMYLKGEKFLWTDWNNPQKNKTEDGFKLTDKVLELGYWRKHPNLHGFIVQTFAKGVDECQNIDLSNENLATIIKAVKNDELPETSGFFFGTTDGDEKEKDLKILESALKWIEEKEEGVSRSIFYRASW